MGKYVVMQYEEGYFSGLNSTGYRVKSIDFVTFKHPKFLVDHNGSFEVKYIPGAYSDGCRIGRIVKVSKKGNVIKTWECQIQVGTNGGNLFLDMSVDNKDMARLLEECVKSGLPYKIYYNQDMVEIWNSTSYNIWKIKTID